ncbi:DUF4944 domain-containing protein [Bacillus sp. Au-Bac7]|uniref:DUF4944 domain-containing protein n=1 Tax=Bacillus sp. Au-Bac7 TaxID=2906458 RepID=UPI001E523131|nr:DUF4944 domain-containing protein [Bacillus sp. Au-Bac7]MCE4051466.1 YdhH/YoaO family protein [Bacillus sp. Au-Bac7]
MNSNKITVPIIIFQFICIVFVLILLGIKFFPISDKWVGTSNDKKWSFTLRETDRKDYHIGELYWKGSKKEEQHINIISFTSKIDNIVYDVIKMESKDEGSNITDRDEMTFMEGIQKEEINNKTIKISIKWSENNMERESHITLKKE